MIPHFFKQFTYLSLLCILGFWGCKPAQNEAQVVHNQILPPLKGVKIKPQTQTIDPTKPQVVRFASGTRVEVPANAFVDAAGKVIKTPVQLSLETYNSPAAILASGIPMTFEENGKQEHFESAGMFQLTGQSEGRAIEIAQNKQLVVNHPSQTSDEDFDFFYFEEEPTAPKIAYAQVLGRRSTKPKKQRRGRWKKLTNNQRDTTQPITKGIDEFRLKFDTKKYPALADLEGVKWQLAFNQQNPRVNKNNWVLKQAWSSLELNKPRVILGQTIKHIPLKPVGNSGYTFVDVAQNGERLIIGYDNRVDILDKSTALIASISGVDFMSGRLPVVDDKYLLLRKKDGQHLYNLNGQQVGYYANAQNFVQMVAKQNRVVFEVEPLDNELVSDHKYIRITDLRGKSIKVLKLDDDSYAGDGVAYVYTSFILAEDKYVVTNSPTGIQVYDFNGKLLKHKKGKYSFITNGGKNEVIANRLYAKKQIIWNFVTGKERDLRPNEVMRYNRESRDTIASAFPKKSEKLKRIIHHQNNQFQLLDWNKQLIINFTAYDAQTIQAGFVNDEQIYTVSKTGIFRLWNANGEVLTTKQWQDRDVTMVLEWTKKFGLEAYNRDLKSYKTYGMKGYLQSYFGKMPVAYINYDSLLIIREPRKSIRFVSLVQRPKQAYQLTLHSPTKEFITYVYLDKATEKLMRKQMPLLKQIIREMGSDYRKEIRRRQKEATERYEQTSKLIKVFSVKKFGIYNCDRLYLVKEPVVFAASFDFGQEVDIKQTPIFLVTEASGPVLIQYFSNTLVDFRINPKAPNQIVAVLPKNKLAIFDREQATKVDWQKVKQAGKYTFKMKIVDNTVENLEALTKVLQ